MYSVEMVFGLLIVVLIVYWLGILVYRCSVLSRFIVVWNLFSCLVVLDSIV